MLCALSFSRSLKILFFSSSDITSSNFTLSVSICFFALSMINCESPSRFEIANALLFPGIPIRSLYVGARVSTSNSHDAFSTLLFEKEAGTNKNLFEEATYESGTITIVEEEIGGAAPKKTGTGEKYIVGEGLRVGKITALKKLSGTFSTIIIPSSVTSISTAGLSSSTMDAIVLKNVNMDATTVSAVMDVIPPVIYYYRPANGIVGTEAYIKSWITENEAEGVIEAKNGLQASASAKVNGNAVTVLGYIAPDDLDFSNVTVEVEFEGVKTKSYTTTAVYTTLAGVATTSSVVNAATGEELIDGTYLTGLTVKGVPAGTYTLKVTLYATALSTNGADEVVCSETVTITNVTVA